MPNFPLSPFRQVGNIFFVSGQIGQIEGALVSDEITEQTAQTIANIAKILEQNSLTIKDVIDSTVFLTDYDDYDAFNEAYRKGFSEPYPSRTTVVIKSLPLSARVEIKVIA